MNYFYSILILISVIWNTGNSQQMDIQPLLTLLRPETMKSMADLATELGSMAAKNIGENERDVQKTAAVPTFDPNGKPSQMIGGAFSNIAYQSRNAFLDVLDKIEPTTSPGLATFSTITFGTNTPVMTTPIPVTLPNIFGIPQRETGTNEDVVGGGSRDILGVRQFKKSNEKIREIRYAEPEPIADVASISENADIAQPAAQSVPLPNPPPPKNTFDGSPFMQIARRFLQVGTGSNANNGRPEPLPQIGIRDFMSGADNNFGIPRGKGCLPFISEFMQIAYGNCQNTADEKTFDAWGEELRRAILTGEIDLLRASQETCRRGAERQQCDSLREAVANCDVMASIEIGTQLQRNMKRCEEVSGMMDQSPAAVLGQLNSLISGEMAQGFLNKFLKTG